MAAVARRQGGMVASGALQASSSHLHRAADAVVWPLPLPKRWPASVVGTACFRAQPELPWTSMAVPWHVWGCYEARRGRQFGETCQLVCHASLCSSEGFGAPLSQTVPWLGPSGSTLQVFCVAGASATHPSALFLTAPGPATASPHRPSAPDLGAGAPPLAVSVRTPHRCRWGEPALSVLLLAPSTQPPHHFASNMTDAPCARRPAGHCRRRRPAAGASCQPAATASSSHEQHSGTCGCHQPA